MLIPRRIVIYYGYLHFRPRYFVKNFAIVRTVQFSWNGSELLVYLFSPKKAGPSGPGFFILPSIATAFSGPAALSETSA